MFSIGSEFFRFLRVASEKIVSIDHLILPFVGAAFLIDIGYILFEWLNLLQELRHYNLAINIHQFVGWWLMAGKAMCALYFVCWLGLRVLRRSQL